MSGCKHCKRNKPAKGKRGLCQTCYGQPDIRALYPVDAFRRPDIIRGLPKSDADLDELVRQQMAKLPAWWKQETDEILEAERPKPMSRMGMAYLRGRTRPRRGQRHNGVIVV